MTASDSLFEVFDDYQDGVRTLEDLYNVMRVADLNVVDINSTLLEACRGGETEVIKAIFNIGEERGEEIINKLFEAKSKSTVAMVPGLYYRKRNFEVFKLLLEGLDLTDNKYDTSDGSLLHFAVRETNIPLFEYLVQTGYSLYKENDQGLTILNTVCISGTDWAGIMLLEAYIDVNHLNSNGYSSLYYTVKHSNIKMFRELIEHNAEFNGEKSIFFTAVEAGNIEIVRFCWEEDRFHPTQEILDESMVLAIKSDFIPIAEFIIERGGQIIGSDMLIKEAITKKQPATSKFLLQNVPLIQLDDVNKTYLSMSDENAYMTFPTILKHWGTLTNIMVGEFLYTIIFSDLWKCGEFFMRYLSDNHVCDISELVFSEFNIREGHCLLEMACYESEKMFIILLDFLDINEIQERPNIYHILLERKHYRGLNKLLNKCLNNRVRLRFLSSIEYEGKLPNGDTYPEDSNYSHLTPSFLHKLKNCEDSKIKFHPLVNAVVLEKLRVYRWWYVLTFVLYCIFLSTLYYALFEASYQCDDMLFTYTGSSGALRAVCEVVVIIYAIMFTIDECMEFVVSFIRFSHLNYQTKNILKAICIKENTIKKYLNFEKLVSHLPSIIKGYFGAFNIVDILGLLFLFLLIIFRLASSPYQWTLASFTIILFTLRLFKYTRIIPSLGAYVQSIFRVFIKDITQFAVIVTIIILAYFGGIHLAARQTFTTRQTTTPLLYSENCSNNSFTGLFWLDEERTSSYDLRRPLLSGIIFLLDGGPGNEETSLLDSNFLFTLLYLSFAFTIIVVMSNILIAQLSQTYAEITKDSDLPFKLDLVVSVEYDSNLAFFFGKYLREHFQENIYNIYSKKLPKDGLADVHSDQTSKFEDNSVFLSTQFDKLSKETTDAFDLQNNSLKKSIEDLKLDINRHNSAVRQDIDSIKEDIAGVKRDLENRMGHVEGMMEEMLRLIQHSAAFTAK